MSKIICVFGSTGSQGGSVARALLKDGKFKVRAATRNVKSEKALALQDAGAELVQAAFDDVATLEAALEGCWGAFFITSFWDSGKGTVEAEVELGKNVALAAKKQNLQHLVFSTLESPAVSSGHAFPTFDAKIGVEQEVLYAGVPFTFVQVAWYFNNLENNHKNAHSGFYPWPKDAEGSYLLKIPFGPKGLHGIHNEDVGPAVAEVFAHPEAFLGRKIDLSGELLQGEAVAEVFSRVFPAQKFKFENQDVNELKGNAVFGDALYNMYSWYIFRMPRGGNLELTKELNPNVHSFEQYLISNQNRYKFE